MPAAPPAPLRVWVDTDAACGTGPRRDPNDSLALLGRLAFWADSVDLDGFYPFDLMAVRYLLAPSRFRCAAVDTWLADDPLLGLSNAPRSLLVAQGAGRLATAPSGRARLRPRAARRRPALHGN